MSDYRIFSLRGFGFSLMTGLVVVVLALFAGAVAAHPASAAAIGEEEVPEGPGLPLEPETGINCSGKILKSKDRDFPYSYRFKCNRELRAFTIVANREIDGTQTEQFGLLPDGRIDLGVPAVPADPDAGTPEIPAVPNGHFICTASLPGWGVACAGRRGQGTLKSGGTMKVGFSLFDPICDANSQPKFWVVPVYEYTEENNLGGGSSIRKFLVPAEPIALNTRAIRCKVLNPKARAKKACAKAKKAKGKAKKKAKADCRKARAAAKASR